MGDSASGLWASVIAVWNPLLGRPAMFVQHTLPFGAAASVLHFNRLARLLWECLVKMLRALVLNFYDDFPTIEPEATAQNARVSMELMLKLLGWQYSDNPMKDLSFAEEFCSLGVIFDLSRTEEQLAFVYNKPSRIESVKTILLELARMKKTTSTERASVKGKLTFMERHVFGRVGKLLTSMLFRVDGSVKTSISREDQILMQDIIKWMTEAKPRRIRPLDNRSPVFIFTDGAEGDVPETLASCGALMIDPEDGCREYFGEGIPDELVTEWKSSGNTKVIAQAELLPVGLAKCLWAERLKDRRVFFFVDNEGAKHQCINFKADSIHSHRILCYIAKLEMTMQTWSWFCRVASHSNPADPASRLDHETMTRVYGAKRVAPIMPRTMKELASL